MRVLDEKFDLKSPLKLYQDLIKDEKVLVDLALKHGVICTTSDECLEEFSQLASISNKLKLETVKGRIRSSLKVLFENSVLNRKFVGKSDSYFYNCNSVNSFYNYSINQEWLKLNKMK